MFSKIKKITGKTFEPYRVYLRPIRDKIRSTYQIIENHLNNMNHLKKMNYYKIRMKF